MKRRSGSGKREAGSGRDEGLAGLAWALAHPARVRILRILLARQGCICGEIVDLLPLAQSTVSQHLKVLKEHGLIQGEIDGPRTCYCVDLAALERLREGIDGLLMQADRKEA